MNDEAIIEPITPQPSASDPGAPAWIGLLALAAGLGIGELVTGFDRLLR